MAWSQPEVSGLRHLGGGVAYLVSSLPPQDIHAKLRVGFLAWFGPQFMQKWQPHITIQNTVTRSKADALYHDLGQSFHAHSIQILGLDLWDYPGGPWRHAKFAPLHETWERAQALKRSTAVRYWVGGSASGY